MGYQLKDKGLVDAIERFQASQAADELALAMAFLERLINSAKDDEETVAMAETVLAFTVKISDLRTKFQRMLQENKVWYHRDSLPQAMSIVFEGIAEILKPIDPCGLLVDQLVVVIQRKFDEAIQELDDGPTPKIKSGR